MSSWGKVIGAAIGLVSGGPIGGVFGLVVGHSIDSSIPRLRRAGDVARIQSVFFERTFELLGHVAKVDGRVSEGEIAVVSSLMERLGLEASARRRAVRCFNVGKAGGFRPTAALASLKDVTEGHEQLRRLAVEMLIDTAVADGRLKPEGRKFLDTVAGLLNIPRGDIDAMLAMRGLADRQQGPFDVLGVAAGASNAEIKKAYRRLMAKHHPDKLVSQGLPPEMLKLAEERTQEIRAAYDQVRRERAF